MVVILDAERAKLLAQQVVRGCSDSKVAVVIILPGGKTLAEQHNTRMGRFMLVREICLMAVQGDRADVITIPQSWAARQSEPAVEAPELTGAALRIYSRTGTQAAPNYQLVGVIGMIGIEAEQAVTLLQEVVGDHGFFTTPDLPHGGVQA